MQEPSTEGLSVRRATRADLPIIIEMLADDDLGATRERATEPLADPYVRAFGEIDADPAHLLAVAELDGEVVGTFQLSVLPYLTHEGSRRGQIEAVRISSGLRGGGAGREMIRWALEEARRRGCAMVQLTSDKRRHEAHRFYESLGFTATHEGMKLTLEA